MPEEKPTNPPAQPVAQASSQTAQKPVAQAATADPKATAKPRAIELSTTEVPDHLTPRQQGGGKNG
jgi:hypothetical protein